MGKNVTQQNNHEYIFLNTSLQYDSNTTKILFMAPSPLPPTALNLPKVHAYYLLQTNKTKKIAGLKYIRTEKQFKLYYNL